jgi:SAM-dependent methyltransferase
MMDELARYNKGRWEALARARVAFSQPMLDLNPTSAQGWLDEKPFFSQYGFDSVAGKDVLCLASGGGQQSAVFSLLGARVTVLDLTETQLARDREAAAHHGYEVTTIQGDMRDLTIFGDDQFDIIWHPYSINFVPDAAKVIYQAGRVIRPGGYYNLDFANPFWSMDEDSWLSQGYPIKQPYITGSQLKFADTFWTFTNDEGEGQRIEGPHEFIHTLGTMVNSLVQAGFLILGLQEWPPGDPQAEPGTWEHLLTIVPPFLTIGALSQPDILRKVH